MNYILDKVKILLGIENNALDEKLKIMAEFASKRLLANLPNYERVPNELDYIVVELVIKRFNKIGNEGMTSFSASSENITFENSDLDEFKNDIADFLQRHDKEEKLYFI